MNNIYNIGYLNLKLYEFCYQGHKELVILMIEKGADNWNLGLFGACSGGHKEIALLMLEKGANDWNRGLFGACAGGYKEYVLIMLKKDEKNIHENLDSTNDLYNVYKELALLMIEKGALIEKCSIPLTTDDYIYLIHKNIFPRSKKGKFDIETESYFRKKQALLLNYEDFWLKMLLNNYI